MGAALITVGYAMAIGGGIILFVNAPPDVGGTYALMIPRTDRPSDAAEESAIRSRLLNNRGGFLLLTVGTLLAALRLLGRPPDSLITLAARSRVRDQSVISGIATLRNFALFAGLFENWGG